MSAFPSSGAAGTGSCNGRRTTRAGNPPVGLVNRLSGRRLQHEHSLVVLQDDAIELAAGTSVGAGFFGFVLPHHPAATDDSDLAHVDRALSLPESRPALT